MENVAHWTQQSTADFVYGIAATFVAQIETKMEEEDVSRSEIAKRLKKTGGRVSQILNNPGNLGLKVMVETAGSLGMKVGVIAYDDHDPTNENGPIDPDVFVKCWEQAGRPANLFEVEDASDFPIWEGYLNNATGAGLLIGAVEQIPAYDVNNPGYIGDLAGLYSTVKAVESVKLNGNFPISPPQVSNLNELWHTPFLSGGFHEKWQQQKPTALVPQENAA
jgi:hypothetical protein